MAQTVVLTQGAYSYSDGGEFTAATSSPTLGIGGYSSYTANSSVSPNTFQTFCVQTDVEFTPGTTYSYNTGLSAIGSGQHYLNGYNGSLTVGTAWLYAEFASGYLGSTYNYANSAGGNNRQTDAGLLQAAIWALQGEAMPNGNYTTPTTVNNLYYNLAISQFGSASAAAVAATTSDNYGVDILQLSTGPNAAQNQLYYNGSGTGLTHENAPDHGTTLVLLGLGLSGLAAFGRKFGSFQPAK